MIRPRVARTWRGVAAASVATFAASVSHSAADGHPAPILGLLLACAFAVPVCVALAGKRLSWWRLSVAVAVSQLAFHGLLTVGVGEPTGTRFVPAAGMAGHAEHLMAIASSSAPMTGMDPTSGWMWVAHGFAALITILAIGHGEKALRALLNLNGWTLLVRILDWRPTPVPRVVPVGAAQVFAVHELFRSSAVRRRGPPATA